MTLSRPQASEMEDSRGTLCRNRRLFGTLQRLRCGWAGQDREGGEGCERAGSSCLFFQGTWLDDHSGRLDITGPITEGRVLINAQIAAGLRAYFAVTLRGRIFTLTLTPSKKPQVCSKDSN